MITYEKRGHIKEYDESGNLLTKILATEAVEETVVEEDLFGEE